MDRIIKVGVGCLVFRDGKLLLGKRLSKTHGSGEYSCGGGHAEFGEDLAQTARREIREEWGIEISDPEFVGIANLRKYANKHYVSIGFRANWLAGEPTIQAGGEFESYDWYSLDQLPSPLFGAIGEYIRAIQTGQVYVDVPK